MSRHHPDRRQAGGPDIEDWRHSRLTGSSGGTGLVVAMADLHNHSLFSDGDGDPETAFAQLRAAGLHAAALTDHSSIPRHAVSGLGPEHYPDDDALALARTAPRSIDGAEWKRTGEIADAHDVPGEFTALRGFEWTEPYLGHVNVWYSHTYTAVSSPGSISGLFAFLTRAEPEALFGYNHPGREPGDLDGYVRPDGDLPRRMVALEAFNRRDDFLFPQRPGAHASPVVACLDAGWRPALIGCSDEHGRDYGLAGKGRTGLWVRELTRDGVREALLARRAFATREPQLRLDARLDGAPAGGRLGRRSNRGELLLEVDLAAPSQDGGDVELQLLTGTGGQVVVLDRRPMTCGVVLRASVPVPPDVPWLLLRVADPHRPYSRRSARSVAPPGHPCDTWALAYASPWYR